MIGTMKKILVVEDHPIFRSGLCAALRDTGRWGPVGEAASVAEALRALEREDWPVLLLDINLPDGEGFAVLEAAASMGKKTASLILSMHVERSYADRAFKLGVLGYASKNLAFTALEKGLQVVAEGQIFLEKEVLKETGLFQPAPAKDPSCLALIDALAPRERELLALLLSGCTVKEAALQLKVSARTAENYQSAIYSKLGASSPVHLVAIALRAGCPSLLQSIRA